MRTSTGLVYFLACLLKPFMPSFADKVLKQLSYTQGVSLYDADIPKMRRPWEILPALHKIGKPEPLFKELKDENVEF
ncbi:hypothetical protein vseg_007837 [Gypsophila vaccaria]